MRDTRPRVLHIFGALSLGGIETWLVHMLRHERHFSVKHELLLTKRDVGPYEAEVRALGITIHRLPWSDGKLSWFGRFRKFLQREGPFAAVHCHDAPHFAAPVLAVAKSVGVPIRIAHSHSARSKGEDYPLRYRLARRVAIPWLKRVATYRIGITEAALEEVVGRKWRRDPAASVLIYGFDFVAYQGAAERARELRKQLGIGASERVIGNIARLMPVKNHQFLLEAFAHLHQREPNSRLVLVGKGPLRDVVAAQAETLGIADRVLFAGTTEDVSTYMAMFDLFVLPSLSEGLGIVCVEAQAAGTPAIVSDRTPVEASVVPGAVDFLPLEVGAPAWGDTMAKRLEQPSPDQAAWLEQVESSRFGIRRCVEELDSLYRSELKRSGLAPA